jgi:RHS repeat-associated protein
MGYEYDLAGNLTSETYPSGRVVETRYDEAGRLAGVKNQATGLYYAGAAPTDVTNRIRYAAHGAMAKMRLGNGLWEHATFNSRLQPVEIGLGTSAGIDAGKLRLTYGYGPAGTNNGNVRSQRIEGGGLDVTQVYEYDALNRLGSAEEKADAISTWKQVYAYDPYGNRSLAAGTTYPDYSQSLIDPVGNPVIDAANNRIKMSAPGQGNYIYDAAGNLTRTLVTAQSYHALAYDAENRQVRADGGSAAGGTDYVYDGEGRRVKKVAGAVATVFVYDAGGRPVAEYSNQVEAKGIRYLTHDQLGNTRVVTDAQGNAHSADGAGGSRHDYFPFGEEIGAGVGLRATAQGYGQIGNIRQKFTGKERDNETGLDYFGARYYASTMGRFNSIDLAPLDLVNPQKLNRYQYVLNNPIYYTDPDGNQEQEESVVSWLMRVVFSRAMWGDKQESPREGPPKTITPGVDRQKSGEDIAYQAFDTYAQGIEYLNETLVYLDFSGQSSVFRAATKNDPLHPDLAAASGEAGIQIALPFFSETGPAKKLIERAFNQLERRFLVELGEDVSKGLYKMADLLAVAKTGKSAVVMEVSIGSKGMSEIRGQLENGVRYMINEKRVRADTIKVYFRTTDRKLAAEVEKMKPLRGGYKVNVILDK